MNANIRDVFVVLAIVFLVGLLTVVLSGCDVSQSTVQSGGAPIVVIPEQPEETQPVEIVPINE